MYKKRIVDINVKNWKRYIIGITIFYIFYIWYV